MDSPLHGKTAIITGGSRGIGKAIALELGSLGAAVTVSYRRNRELAEEVVEKITAMGGQSLGLAADMKNVREIEALFAATLDTFGSVDILVNNAGTFLVKPIAKTTEQEFDKLFNTNVKGLFFACRQAARTMADGGRIINISSSVTRVMLPHYGLYGASKGAVEQITKVLARELGTRGIAVNSVSPGPVDTELFRKDKSPEQIRALADMAAFGRIGTPQDIARVIRFLVSEEAGWITGQNLPVNGGLVA